MKSCLFILLLGLTSLNSLSINIYQKGDSLYVWAKNGLKLRDKPNLKSNITAIIPYGQSIIANENRNEITSNPLSITEVKATESESKNIPEFKIRGRWLNVNYQGKIGYVFDGYLSKLPTYIKNENHHNYFDRIFNTSHLIKDTISLDKFETKKFYNNGAYTIENIDYCCGSRYSILPLSIEESYLIFTHQSPNYNNTETMFLGYGSDKNIVCFGYLFGHIEVIPINDKWVIVIDKWGN